MNETTKKIKAGTIRIENGSLIGLGICGKESIDIEALDELMDAIGRHKVAESVSEVISAIAEIHSECCFADEWDNPEVADFVNKKIRPIVRDIETYHLHQIVKTFSK